ncbi:MAG: von Willebrand factor type [Chlorobi bacterium]|nr:von Willebrand factor type [Chlorobiota bacterium]
MIMMTMRLRTGLPFLLALGLSMVPALLSAQGTVARDSTERDMKAGDALSAPVPTAKIGTTTPAGSFESVGSSAVGRGSFSNQAVHIGSPGFTSSAGGLGTYGGTLGATIGGAKDIGYARQLINAGSIPKFLDFSPEGLYSEHDIPVPSGDCAEPLCLSLGYGYAPTVDDKSNALFVHLGLNSNVQAEGFRRSNLQLVVVVDRSGSMQGNMASVQAALRKLAEKLTADDEILMVEFDDQAELLLPATRGDRRADILAAINRIRVVGGTNLFSGMVMGYTQLDNLPSRPGAMKRMLLFTDEQPNVGITSEGSFLGTIEEYSKKNIGLSLFGVGSNFGQDVAYKVSQARGANMFFLESPEKIATVFDKEFDYLVTPLVYDLHVKIATPAGMKLKAVYGLPTWTPGSHDAELNVPTVFLSSNHGAIILRYEKDGDGPLAFHPGDELASGDLSFTDIGGRTHNEHADLHHTGTAGMEPGTQFYTHDGMRMAVALTNIYFGLRDGCTLLTEGKRKEAIDVIGRAKGVAMIENTVLQNEGLADEIKLLDKLEENINKGVATRSDGPAND